MPTKINVRGSTLELIDDALTTIFDRKYLINLPIDPRTELNHIPNCSHLSYAQLAEINHCSHQEVIKACRSINGCTCYDPDRNYYMVYINYDHRNSISFRRIRWTTAHEIGHIVCGHFIEVIKAGAPDVFPSDVKLFEEEADFFASCLLAPLPVLDRLRINSADDLYRYFMLSRTAAEYTWHDLQRYRSGEISYPNRARGVLERNHPRLTTKLPIRTLHDQKKLDDFLYYA